MQLKDGNTITKKKIAEIETIQRRITSVSSQLSNFPDNATSMSYLSTLKRYSGLLTKKKNDITTAERLNWNIISELASKLGNLNGIIGASGLDALTNAALLSERNSAIEAGAKLFTEDGDYISFEDGKLVFTSKDGTRRDGIELVEAGFDGTCNWEAWQSALGGDSTTLHSTEKDVLWSLINSDNVNWQNSNEAFEYFQSVTGSYGVDQGMFKGGNSSEDFDISVAHLKNEYGLNDTEAAFYVSHMDSTGCCSHTAVTNAIISQFVNNPSEYKEVFGMPLYRQTSSGEVVLNGGQLLTDIYAYYNSGYKGDVREGSTEGETQLLSNGDGTYKVNFNGEDPAFIGDDMVYQNTAGWGWLYSISGDQALQHDTEVMQGYVASKNDNYTVEVATPTNGEEIQEYLDNGYGIYCSIGGYATDATFIDLSGQVQRPRTWLAIEGEENTRIDDVRISCCSCYWGRRVRI